MSFLKRLTSKKSSSTPNAGAKASIIQTNRDSTVPTRSVPTRRPLQTLTNDEAPPAYTPRTNSTAANVPEAAEPVSPVHIPSTPTQAEVLTTTPEPPAPTKGDSQFAFLAEFDTIFLIDDSGSMAGTRWGITAQAIASIAPTCTEWDADGIDIYFLNYKARTNSGLGGFKNITDGAGVLQTFAKVTPNGSTPTGTRLNAILKPYILDLEADLKKVARGSEPSVKPLNIIVITDGVASDDVESVIVQAAKKLDKLNAEPWQVGIQFFQIGNEPEAAKELQELDDYLATQHDIRDMVDTVPWSADGPQMLENDFILKVVMGSVNRRLDRKAVV